MSSILIIDLTRPHTLHLLELHAVNIERWERELSKKLGRPVRLKKVCKLPEGRARDAFLSFGMSIFTGPSPCLVAYVGVSTQFKDEGTCLQYVQTFKMKGMTVWPGLRDEFASALAVFENLTWVNLESIDYSRELVRALVPVFMKLPNLT